jgi:hypothetical protein
MTLTATEFLRRFFLHVLPKGFVRIRHFGFLANRFRASRLTLGRQLLAFSSSTKLQVRTHDLHPESSFLWHCPRCGASMIVIQRFTTAEISACTYSIPPSASITCETRMCGSTPIHSCAHPRSTTSHRVRRKRQGLPPHRKRLGSSFFRTRSAPPGRFRSRLATIRELFRFASV